MNCLFIYNYFFYYYNIFSELLIELYNISETHNLGPAMQIKIKFAIVSAIFDYNPKISAAIKPEYWEKCMPHVEELLTMIDDNRAEVTTGDGIGKINLPLKNRTM